VSEDQRIVLKVGFTTAKGGIRDLPCLPRLPSREYYPSPLYQAHERRSFPFAFLLSRLRLPPGPTPHTADETARSSTALHWFPFDLLRPLFFRSAFQLSTSRCCKWRSCESLLVLRRLDYPFPLFQSGLFFRIAPDVFLLFALNRKQPAPILLVCSTAVHDFPGHPRAPVFAIPLRCEFKRRVLRAVFASRTVHVRAPQALGSTRLSMTTSCVFQESPPNERWRRCQPVQVRLDLVGPVPSSWQGSCPFLPLLKALRFSPPPFLSENFPY